MPYEVAVDEDHKIVTVRLWGIVLSGEHRAARREAARLCVEREFRRLLVDLRDIKPQRTSSTMRCFDFGESLVQGAVPKGTFIAHVMPTDPASFRDVHFTVNVAKNRGGFVEEFTTLAEASQWLLSLHDE